MASREEIRKLRNTLRFLENVFESLGIEHRIFGSIIPATLLGRPQRKLGDIDLMTAVKDEGKLFQQFIKNGYKVERRRFKFLGLEMIWLEARRESLCDLTIFLGNFDQNKNFVVKISKNLKAVVPRQAIKATRYKFAGASFVGIPISTAYFGAWISRNNPKRKYDLAVFKLKKKNKLPNYSVMDFYYKGKKIPFLYTFCCCLQNLLGRISVLLGGNYDFWRKP